MLDNSIPVPDFGFVDLFPVSFDCDIDPLSAGRPLTDVAELIGHFGFQLANPSPLRCTTNSSVYVAVDPVEEPCALKISCYHIRLMTEFQNRIIFGDHNSLVASYDVFQTDNFTILQMELCPDGDLHAKKLSELECWQLLINIGDALDVIHNAGFVHLDVSPSNIFRLEQYFKLGDFGNVRAIGEFQPGDEGAGPYAAPEVLSGSKSVGWPADIFSFGICMLEAASGYFAPRGGDDWYRAIREGKLLLGGESYPCDCSNELIWIINAMIEPNPEQRPTAATLAYTGRRAIRNFGK
jgi:serine/threonine protein kinase